MSATTTAVTPIRRSLLPRLLGSPRDAEASKLLLEFRSPTSAVIAQPLPLGGRITIWVIAAAASAAIAAISCMAVDRVVAVPGKVVAQTSNIVVQPWETSIVRWIGVKEGQTVHAGDLLARLDPTVATAEATASDTQTASLQAEVDRLEAESLGHPYLSDGTPSGELQAMTYTQRHAEQSAKLETYRQKIDSARSQLAKSEADVFGYAQQFDAARTKEAMRRELERLQVGSKLNSLDATAARSEAERALKAANANRLTAQSDLEALISERNSAVDQYRRETLQQLTEQGRKLADAKEQRSKAALRRSLVELRASRDAIVLNIARVSVGSVLQSGDDFITLVPTDAPLEIEAGVSGRDVGFVRTGNPSVIKFDTFPYTTYGYASGTVQTISADSFMDPRRDREPPSRPNTSRGESLNDGAYFRAHVSLDEMKLHGLPAGFHLIPGMPVTVDIKVGQRTILGYLMSRVIPILSEGMREP
jgi:HlyD family secretion protein